MWDHFTLGKEIFDAGINQTLTATLERKHLEWEANNFNLWHGADLPLKEDTSNGELLLDKLEQDDTLSDLLQNAHKCIFLDGLVSTMLTMFWIDLNVPDAADLTTRHKRTQEQWFLVTL